MAVIYKYEIEPPLKPSTVSTVSLPKGAKIRHFGTQENIGDEERMYVWAEVDPNAAEELVAFQVLATGIQTPDENLWEWAATVQFTSYPLVFHIYREVVRN